MAFYRMVPGQLIQRDGAVYEIVTVGKSGTVVLNDIAGGTIVRLEMASLLDEYFVSRSLTFVPRTGQGEPGRRRTHDTASPYELAVMEFRLTVLGPLLVLSKRTRKDVAERVAEVNAKVPPGEGRTMLNSTSISAVYDWIKRFNEAGGDPTSLIPRLGERGAPGESRLQPEVETAIQDALKKYLLHQPPESASSVHQMVHARIRELNERRDGGALLTPPGQSTIERRAADLDIELRVKAQQGERAANRALGQFDTRFEDLQVMEAIEADWTEADLIVIDEKDNTPVGRFNLGVSFELSTIMPAGIFMGFEPPSLYSLGQLIQNTAMSKSGYQERYGLANPWPVCGMPKKVYVDRAMAHKARGMDDSNLKFRVDLIQGPKATPNLRGLAEAGIRHIQDKTFHIADGTTYGSPMRRGDYKSMQTACLLLEDAVHMVMTYVVDIAAQTRSRKRGWVPYLEWLRRTENGYIPRLPESAKELEILFGESTERTIQHYGIDWDILRYQAKELGPLRMRLGDSARVKVKRNPGDLSRIYVLDPFEEYFIEVPVIPAAEEYAHNLTRWQHKIIWELAKRNDDPMDIANLGEARLRVQRRIEQARERTAKGRRSAHRFATGGRNAVNPAEEAPQGQATSQEPDQSPASEPAPAPMDPTMRFVSEEVWDPDVKPN